MAKFIDAYRRPSPIAAAISNFGQTFFGDTLTPALKREQLRGAERKNDAIESLSAQLGPLAGDAVAAGVEPGPLNLFVQSQNPENDLFGDAIARAAVGAGQNFNTTPMFNANREARLGGEADARLAEDRRAAEAALAEIARKNRDGLAEEQRQFDQGLVPFTDPNTGVASQLPREQYLELLRQRRDAGGPLPAPVISRAEAQGGLATRQIANGELSPTEEKEATGARVEVQRFVDADRNAYVSIDGITDLMTGEPLPAGLMSLGTASAQGDGGPESVLTKTNETAVQAEAMSLRNFEGLLKTTTDMANKMTAADFGVAGEARRFAQAMFGTAEGLDALVGGGEGAFEKAAESIVSTPIETDDGTLIQARREIFDPNLPNIVRAANLLAYSAASALAGQDGRGLSDQDFKTFRDKVIGDPRKLFASKDSFVSGLRFLEGELQRRIANNRTSRSGDLDSPSATTGGTGGAQRRRYNPDTGELEPVQ